MNILAVDTSSQALCVAVKTDNSFSSAMKSCQSLMHSENLLPTILNLCKECSIETTDLDLLVCTRGPGSFTGLRIGMSALKGMAWALEKPLVSISTLETYAFMANAEDNAVVSVLDAKKKRWYLGAFAGGKRILQDTDGTEADLIQVLKPYKKVLVTGPDCKAFAPILAGVLDKDVVVQADLVEFRNPATALITLGQIALKENGPDNIGQGPVYIRKSDAEIALELKEASNSGEV